MCLLNHLNITGFRLLFAYQSPYDFPCTSIFHFFPFLTVNTSFSPVTHGVELRCLLFFFVLFFDGVIYVFHLLPGEPNIEKKQFILCMILYTKSRKEVNATSIKSM